MATNQGCKGLVPTDAVDSKFLFYYLGSIVPELNALGTGTTFKELSGEKLREVGLPLPKLAEQRRIVAILDEAFEGIAAAKANADKNLLNVRAVFENYVSGILESTAAEWAREPFGELAEFRNGVNFTKASNGDTLKIVGVKDFQDNLLVPVDELATVQIGGSIDDVDLLAKDDLLFVRSNGSADLVGRCLLVGKVKERTTHSGFTIRARLTTDRVSAPYICRLVRSARVRKLLVAGGTGLSIKSLNQGTLAQLELPIPKRAEQDRICDKIDAIQSDTKKLETLCITKLESLDRLKKSLLHQAFSGQL